jgi:hydroxypyruvate isomerase
MKRRTFLVNAAGAGAGLALRTPGQKEAAESRPGFRLKYAPHFGMFEHHAGQNHLDQLKFMADQGFRAFEDNGMKRRSNAEQERIGRELERLGMQMGVFVATADFQNVTFASDKPEVIEKILSDIRESVDVARRVNATWTTVVPGCFDPGLEWDYQTANVIENLKRCAEIVEPHGLVMVLEPLNPWKNHPGLFLSKIPQAYLICRTVGSPSCKILFDIYHQQITEGNLIPNMTHAWKEIAYFQIGDNPGRNEPTTGEINYRNLFKHLHSKDYTGILGMEHGNAKPGLEGERALLKAYRYCDSF